MITGGKDTDQTPTKLARWGRELFTVTLDHTRASDSLICTHLVWCTYETVSRRNGITLICYPRRFSYAVLL